MGMDENIIFMAGETYQFGKTEELINILSGGITDAEI